MRAKSAEAAKPENSHPYGDTMFPAATSPKAYGDMMREYLGGPWGEQAAAWHPPVALGVAAWLDATADDLAENSILDRPRDRGVRAACARGAVVRLLRRGHRICDLHGTRPAVLLLPMVDRPGRRSGVPPAEQHARFGHPMNRRYIATDDHGAVWLYEQTTDRGRTRHDVKLAAKDETEVAA